MATKSALVQELLGGIAGLAFYVPLFPRSIRNNRGNRLVESGSLAALGFVLLGAANSISHFPLWAAFCLGTLTFALCLATLFFVVQRIYKAFGNQESRKRI